MSDAVQSDSEGGYKTVQIGPKAFQIPREWNIKTIPELCNLETKSFDVSSHEENTFEYIDIESVSRGTIDTSKTIPVEEAPSRAKQIVEAGDTLVGKVRPYLQAFAPVTEEYDGVVCSTGFAVLSANENISSSYLTQAVLSKYFLDQMTNRMTGTSYPAVNKSDFNSIQLFVPPLPEQHNITNILSTVNEQIQQTDRIIQEVEKLKKSLFNDLISTGIDQNTTTRNVKVGPIQVEIPDSWAIERLRDIVSDENGAIRTGPFGSKLKNEHHVSDGVKLYEQRHVYQEDFTIGDRHVTEEWYHSELTSYGARPFDVLITLQGTVGEAAMIPEDAEEGVINPKLIRIRVDDSIVDAQFLARFLDDSHISNQQIESLSHGAVVSGLTVKTVGQIKVPLPPVSEQKKIVDVVDEVDEILSNERQRKKRLKELKRGLMQDLLTGKVRVNTD